MIMKVHTMEIDERKEFKYFISSHILGINVLY